LANVTINGNAMTQAGFSGRLWRAWLLLQNARNERVTQVQIAAELTEAGVPMKQAAISAWFRGEAEPQSRKSWVALAKVLSWGERGQRGWVDPAWLMFGDDTEAKGPEDLSSWTAEPHP
jgi:hypothetical protein